MPGITLTVGGTTVTVSGSAHIDHALKHSLDESPTRAGDHLKTLGRKSKVFTIPDGVIYAHDADATALTRIQQLRTWLEGANTISVTTQTESAVSCNLVALKVLENAAQKGYGAVMTLVEVV